VEKILVVDDEVPIVTLLQFNLEAAGYVVVTALDGQYGYELVKKERPDLIILDLMLPGMDGIDVCRKLRAKKATPVLMLTARGEETSRVEGFEAGTDDYVVKPFSPREVVLRVKALLRRSSPTAYLRTDTHARNVIVLPNLIIDHDAHRVTVGDTEVNLTPKEYELLHFLAQHPDKVFTREELLREVWHYEFFGDLRTVDTHIKRLREKLNRASPKAAEMIVTVWGVGYKLEVPRT